jgi:hypothetical protein
LLVHHSRISIHATDARSTPNELFQKSPPPDDEALGAAGRVVENDSVV